MERHNFSSPHGIYASSSNSTTEDLKTLHSYWRKCGKQYSAKYTFTSCGSWTYILICFSTVHVQVNNAITSYLHILISYTTYSLIMKLRFLFFILSTTSTYSCIFHHYLTRELRKLRSTIRVQPTKLRSVESSTLTPSNKSRNNVSVQLGSQSRTERADLIEKFTQSILLSGGYVVYWLCGICPSYLLFNCSHFVWFDFRQNAIISMFPS